MKTAKGGAAIVGVRLREIKIKGWASPPASEYADSCRLGDWKDYTPKEIDLHQFMEEFLPNLIREGVRVSIFDTPSEDTVTINDSELIDDLKEELSKIE